MTIPKLRYDRCRGKPINFTMFMQAKGSDPGPDWSAIPLRLNRHLGPILIVLLGGIAQIAVPFQAFAGPVQNGDFEQALGLEWSIKNAQPNPLPLSPSIQRIPGTRTGGLGQWVLETTTRDSEKDGPQQGDPSTAAFKNALIAAGNGNAYTTRIWVKLDPTAIEASFRCLLRWRDNGVQQIPLILAEAVVTQPGVWVEATATTTLTWTTSLSSATIDFEVEQIHRGSSTNPPPQWFPSFQIDDLQMEVDTDGDGLWDSEESNDHTQTSLSFSDDADSDDDRMPDDWEKTHDLNMRDAADASLDPDTDGFTNVQEFFAATNPHDPQQYPGKPSDLLATHPTRALLRYLALRPSQQQALVGQMVSDNATDYDAFLTALAAKPGWGRWPAILGLAAEGQNTALDITASVDHAIAYTLAGGIAQIKWSMYNPWTGNNFSDVSHIDIPGLLDPSGTPTTNNTAAENLAAREVVLNWIDTVATELIRFRDETGGAPIIVRLLSEMNGGWFWWGHRTRAEYLGLWNLIRDRLSQPSPQGHDLHNIIWSYESAQTEHMHPVPNGVATASDYYYPGDDRVDIMSHNLYDDEWDLPWDANKIYSRYPKIYGVPQAGPGKSSLTSRDGSFDNMTYIDQIAARYPRASFFISWNSFTAHDDDDNNPFTPSMNDDADPLTNDTPTYKHLALIDNDNADLLLSDSRVITRDELLWRPATEFNAASSASQIALSWTPSPGGTGYRIEQSPDGTSDWTDIAGIPPETSDFTVAQLEPLTAWFRVRTLYGSEDSLPSDPLIAAIWTLYQKWKNDILGNFNAPDNADYDGDGLVSLLEYALDADPLANSFAQQPIQTLVNIDGLDYGALTFRRRADPTGVTYFVESTGNLATDPWLPQPIAFGDPVNNDDGTVTVSFRDLIPITAGPARFLRLHITSP